ncbi:SDR family NAD(P)-dependent oxidoreductase [Candidatus Neomarinimicrobiota bacterium]
MKIDFSGKTALVTGGTRGIGAAIGRLLHQAGACVILTGTKKEEIASLNRTHKEDKRLQYIQSDFGAKDSLEEFLDALSRYDRIDICVNNAGTNRIGLVEDTHADDYDLLTDINLRAPYLICREVSRKMKAENYGRIVNIASIWGVVTKAGRSVYTATKHGLVGLTKTLSVELAPYNVLVNAVSPGFTLTELSKATLSEAERKEATAMIPIQRFAEPEEIARVVLFLASDLNTYLTGQNIVVDGAFVNI